MLGCGSCVFVVVLFVVVVFNQLLLVQLIIGEVLVGGYLEGKVISDDSVLKVDCFEVFGVDGQLVGVVQKLIGVINLFGVMVNWLMFGVSGLGLVSYVVVCDFFDELFNDDVVIFIILWLDMLGGMVFGCFDLVDYIFDVCGRKLMYVLVDDYVYFVGFVFVLVCDEIWVSCIGGVGLVGVVCFYYDWSGNNVQIGLKVILFFVGVCKVDFNFNFFFSEEVYVEVMVDLEDMYMLFVDIVVCNFDM